MGRCANCQSELPGDASFCPVCGAPVPAGQPWAEPQPTQVLPQPQPYEPQPQYAPQQPYEQQPQYAPPQPPPYGQPAGPQPPKRSGAALWVVLGVVAILLLCCAATAGGGYWFYRTNVEPELVAVPTDMTESAESTATATEDAVEPVEAPAPTPEAAPQASRPNTEDDGRQFLRINRLYKKGGVLYAEVDFMQLFTGDAAQREAAKEGEVADNDVWVKNVNPKLRTFPVAPGAPVRIAVNHPEDVRRYSAGEFYNEYKSDPGRWEYTAFFFTIENGEVTDIENFWTP